MRKQVLAGQIAEVHPAAASTTTVSTGQIIGLSKYAAVDLYVAIRGGTGGTLDVYLQTSPDNGVTWWDVAHFIQLADGGALTRYRLSFPQPPASAAPVVIGGGSAVAPGVALAAGTWVGLNLGDRLRAVFVTGAGHSAGAAQSIVAYGSRD